MKTEPTWDSRGEWQGQPLPGHKRVRVFAPTLHTAALPVDLGWGWCEVTGPGRMLRVSLELQPGLSPRFCWDRGWEEASRTRASGRWLGCAEHPFPPVGWSDRQKGEGLFHQELPAGVRPGRNPGKGWAVGRKACTHHNFLTALLRYNWQAIDHPGWECPIWYVLTGAYTREIVTAVQVASHLPGMVPFCGWLLQFPNRTF